MSVNQQTFKNLYDTHRDRLLNAMTAVVKNRDIAEDITSAAFAKACEQLAGFRGESSFYSWLFTIAMNQARAGWRNDRGVRLESIDGDLVGELSEPTGYEFAIEQSESRLRLRRALRQVPARHRQTLIKHFVLRQSVKRIARQERVPVGTVLSRIFTGKRYLRHAWKSITTE